MSEIQKKKVLLCVRCGMRVELIAANFIQGGVGVRLEGKKS